MGQSGDDETFYNKLIRSDGRVCQHPHHHHLHSKAGTQRCNTAPSEGDSALECQAAPNSRSCFLAVFLFFHVRRCRSSSFLLKHIKDEQALCKQKAPRSDKRERETHRCSATFKTDRQNIKSGLKRLPCRLHMSDCSKVRGQRVISASAS